jgi:anti-sigma B factor antagonist
VASSAPTGAQPALSLAVTVDLPAAHVRVAGELDRGSAHHLLDAVEVLSTGSSRRWQLDAGGVTFCDVEGMRALSNAHSLAAAQGRDLHLVRTSRPVDRMVELLGPERVFPTHGSHRRRRGPLPARHVRCVTTGNG